MKNIIIINELTEENDLEKEILKKVQELKEGKIKYILIRFSK